jgi:hypothetical protein
MAWRLPIAVPGLAGLAAPAEAAEVSTGFFTGGRLRVRWVFDLRR